LPLQYTGEHHISLSGTRFKAIGSQGEHIMVQGSHEAIEDYGEDAVKRKGSDKYDAGETREGTLIILTSDFK
jgi:hypothetical protein